MKRRVMAMSTVREMGRRNNSTEVTPHKKSQLYTDVFSKLDNSDTKMSFLKGSSSQDWNILKIVLLHVPL
jgi:hypothetical protein